MGLGLGGVGSWIKWNLGAGVRFLNFLVRDMVKDKGRIRLYITICIYSYTDR